MANQICEGGVSENGYDREHEFIIYVGKRCPLCEAFNELYELEDDLNEAHYDKEAAEEQQVLLDEELDDVRCDLALETEAKEKLEYEVDELKERIEDLKSELEEAKEVF